MPEAARRGDGRPGGEACAETRPAINIRSYELRQRCLRMRKPLPAASAPSPHRQRRRPTPQGTLQIRIDEAWWPPLCCARWVWRARWLRPPDFGIGRARNGGAQDRGELKHLSYVRSLPLEARPRLIGCSASSTPLRARPRAGLSRLARWGRSQQQARGSARAGARCEDRVWWIYSGASRAQERREMSSAADPDPANLEIPTAWQRPHRAAAAACRREGRTARHVCRGAGVPS